ncbi:MAG: DUF1080 domain-containing protein [Blastocatellia bacterium]
MIRKLTMALMVLFCMSVTSFAQDKAFLGKWDIQGVAPNENAVYWLEVRQGTGGLEASFLNRGGSVLKVHGLKIENGELSFKVHERANSPVVKATVEKDMLHGTTTAGNNTIKWMGVRPPKWGKHNANAKHKYGAPVVLFDGKSLDAFFPQMKNKAISWNIVDGVMTNDSHGNNLVSHQKFLNYKINCEYKLEPKQPGGNAANSGIYMRGRYELQVLDDETANSDNLHSHMALYSRVGPSVKASKKAGEWQEMEAIIAGNRLTVKLNGQLVHDNIVIDGITGGALDSREGEPGPVMIQGDHEKVYFRKVVVTPITGK